MSFLLKIYHVISDELTAIYTEVNYLYQLWLAQMLKEDHKI